MFAFNHFNFNVLDLEKSLKFYDEALGLQMLELLECWEYSSCGIVLTPSRARLILTALRCEA